MVVAGAAIAAGIVKHIINPSTVNKHEQEKYMNEFFTVTLRL